MVSFKRPVICNAAVRFSLGRFTTLEEVERAAALIVRVVEEITGFQLGEPSRA
jgi:cysteine sulfinate desulfinase/cysteine desulfurase-like protein